LLSFCLAPEAIPAGQAPDDAVKVFIGPIPRDLDEAALMTMFQKFGTVYEIFVIREKQTKQSKGLWIFM